MTQLKVIAYSKELSNWPCFNKIFADFEILLSDSESDFLIKIKSLLVDAAVICFCSPIEKDAEELKQLNALTGPIPLIACSKSAHFHVTFKAGQSGVEDFLQCTSDVEENREHVQQAIQKGNFKKHLENIYPGCLSASPYICKMIKFIIQNFPQRIKEKDIAERLDISSQWLESQIKKTFGMNYSKLIRRIWVYQALLIMKNTEYNNSDIAEQLNYHEECHMARDFKNELALLPNEARRLLLSGTEPKELMK